MSKKISLNVLGLILLLVCNFIFFEYKNSEEEVVASSEKQEDPKPVKTLVIGDPTGKVTRRIPGVVESSNRVEMSFEVPGTLVEVNAIRGKFLKKGEVVAKINQENYRSKMNERKAKLQELKLSYERHKRLLKKGYVSQAIYDNSKASYEVAKANYRIALKNLKDTTIVAPYDSVVSDVYIDNYQQIVIKQPIVLLQDPEEIDIIVDISENDFIKIKNINDYNFQAIFEGVSIKKYALAYRKNELNADFRTQTYKIYLTMRVPKELNILPGMTAIVEIYNKEKETDKKFYLLPSHSIFSDSTDSKFVWIVDKSTSKLKKRSVDLKDFSEGDNIKVDSGLQKGDVVVIAGVNFLRENMLVKPISN